MEPIHIHSRHKTTKFAPEDVISSMPDIVITDILNRLSLQDAVRTGVLSRNWRFKWTMLSQLVFDDNFFNYLLKRKVKDNHVRIIDRILLHLRDTITKFVLFIYDPESDVEHVNYWILFLSRKGIKDLTLENIAETPLMLPTHIFSCLELTHMKLYCCCFDLPFSFHGFPNLLSLELSQDYEIIEPGDLFTRCPLIEILKYTVLSDPGSVKLVEITKLENLKILSFSLCDLDSDITNSSIIFELLGSLPKLQELDLVFKFYEDDDPTPGSCSVEVDYNTTGLLQLQNVVFKDLRGSENELWLIKYVLAYSPFLKNIVIRHHWFIEDDEKLVFARKLLKLHRASSVVDIDLY